MTLMGRFANWITCGMPEVMHAQANLIEAQKKHNESLIRVTETQKRLIEVQDTMIEHSDSYIKSLEKVNEFYKVREALHANRTH